MNDEPMMVDETEDFQQHRRSPRRSWKIFQLVVAGLLTAFVVAMTLTDQWGKTFGGATKAQIAEFEMATNDYFDEAQGQGVARVTVDLFKPDEMGAAFGSTKSMAKARQRAQEVARALGYQNITKAGDMFSVLAILHNDSMPPPKILTAKQVAEIDRQQSFDEDFDWRSARPMENDEPWVMRDIPAGLWAGIQAAAIAFVGVWLVLKLCELFWWFLMDRLRDVANAVRKS
jgi:hypothetical protein